MKKIFNILLACVLLITTISMPINADTDPTCQEIPHDWIDEEVSKYIIKDSEGNEIDFSNDIELDIHSNYQVFMDFGFIIPDDLDVTDSDVYCIDLPNSFDIQGKDTITIDDENYGQIVVEDGKIKINFENVDEFNNEGNREFKLALRGVIDVDYIIENIKEEIRLPYLDKESPSITIKGKNNQLRDEDKKTAIAIKRLDDGSEIELNGSNIGATHIKWEVLINSSMQKYENVLIKDELSNGHKLDKESFKLYKLERNLKGEELSREEVSIADLSFIDDRIFQFNLDHIEHTYILEYYSEIELQEDSSETFIFSNFVSINKDDIEQNFEKEIEVEWLDNLPKLNKNYEKLSDDRIRWVIDYNASGQKLGSDVHLKDQLNVGQIDYESMKVFEINRNSFNGQIEQGRELRNEEYVINKGEDNRSFDLKVAQGKDGQGYRVVYESDVPGAYEGVIKNKVIDENSEDGPHVEEEIKVSTKPGTTKVGKLDVDENGLPFIKWTIIVNKEHFYLGSFTIKDRFDTQYLELVEESFEIFTVEKGKSILNDRKVYENKHSVTKNIIDDQGFDIKINPGEGYQNHAFVITYTTTVTEAAIEEKQDKLINNVSVLFSPDNVYGDVGQGLESEEIEVDIQGPKPSIEKSNELFYHRNEEDGKYYAYLKWEIIFNENKLKLDNFELHDKFSDHLILVENPKVNYENDLPLVSVYRIENNTEVDASSSFELMVNDKQNEFTLKKNQLQNIPYKLVYYTKVMDEINGEVIHKDAENEATVKWKGLENSTKSKHNKPKAGLEKKLLSNEKNTLKTDDHKELEWEILFNTNKNLIHNFELIDEIQPSSSTVVEGSFKLEKIVDGTPIEITNLETEGFELEFSEEEGKLFKLVNARLNPYTYRITYRTTYEPELEKDDVENSVSIRYASDGLEEKKASKEKKDLQVVKEGEIVHVKNENGNYEIEWTILANQNYRTLKNAKIKDLFHQNNTGELEHLVLGDDFEIQVFKKSEKEEFTEYLYSEEKLKLEKIDDLNVNPYQNQKAITGFEFELPDGAYQYKLIFKTEIISYPSFNPQGYVNLVELLNLSNEEKANFEAKVPFYKGENNNKPRKEGKQNEDTDLLEWTVLINKDGHSIKNAKIEDEIKSKHQYVEDSISIKLQLDSNLTEEKFYQLEKDTHYNVTYDDDKMIIKFNDFNLEVNGKMYREFSDEINHTYLIDYKTELNDDVIGQVTVSNKVSIIGEEERYIEGSRETKVETEKWYIGSSASSNVGKLKITKIGSDTDEKITGSRFVLKRYKAKDQFDPNRSSLEQWLEETAFSHQYHFDLSESGSLELDKIKPGLFVLIEETAPTGYELLESPIFLSLQVNRDSTIKVTTDSKLTTNENQLELSGTHEIKVINERITTDFTVEKSWDISNNKQLESHYEKLPEITMNLKRNGSDQVIDSVNLNQEKLMHTWTNLPKINPKNGEEYEYYIEEKMPDSFFHEIIKLENGVRIVNKVKDEKTSLTVRKTWSDFNNIYGTRPDTIIFVVQNKNTGLIIEEVEVDVNLLENEDDIVISNLPKYDRYGYEIEYEVIEREVLGYDSISTKDEDLFMFENKLSEENLKNITVEKEWIDDENRDGKRPNSIEVYLTMKTETGSIVRIGDPVTLSSPDWVYTFENLPIKSQGLEIEYGVEEVYDGPYVSEIDGFLITNSYEVETYDIRIEKKWDDGENEYGKRPEEIVVRLLANDEVVEGYESIVLNKENAWSYQVEGLVKYHNQGELINYTIEEIDVDYYDSKLETIVDDNQIHFILTNTELFDIDVKKIWNDNNNRDGLRPNEVTVSLYNESTLIDTVKLSTDNNWSHTFKSLQRFENGKEIEYRILESQVDGYSTEIVREKDQSLFKVINTHEIGKVDVHFVKTWTDDQNRDGLRPVEIVVELYADGEKIDEQVLSEDNSWQGSFVNLDEYKEAKVGHKIEYTIKEQDVDSYTTNIIELSPNRYEINNTHESIERNISVEKVWNDFNNKFNHRPEKILVDLIANGIIIETVELSEETDWKYEFIDLYTFENGIEINYIIEEHPIFAYENQVSGNMDSGFVITNSIDSKILGVTKKPRPKEEIGLPQTGMGFSSQFIIGAIFILLGSLFSRYKKD